MKKVSYFGFELEVRDYVNYLAFELINLDNIQDGYILYGYISKPEWVKSSKLWYDSKYNRTPLPKYNPILQEIRDDGVKPSKSLVFIGDKND